MRGRCELGTKNILDKGKLCNDLHSTHFACALDGVLFVDAGEVALAPAAVGALLAE